MSTISCAEFCEGLEDLVVARGHVDPVPLDPVPLGRHADGCADCRVRWQQHVLLDRAIAAWQMESPKVDLADTVLARLAFERGRIRADAGEDVTIATLPQSPRPGRTNVERHTPSETFVTNPAKVVGKRSGVRQSAALLTVTAMVLLTVGVILVRPTSRQPAVAHRVHSDRIVAALKSGAGSTPQSDPELESLLQNAGSAYLVLAHGTAEMVADASLLIAPTDRFAYEPSSGETRPGSKAEWTDRWGRELKPIGREFGAALNFLIDAVPPDSSPTT